MRKFLRMFLVCLMTMFCGTVMADEVTIKGEQLTDYANEGGTVVNGFTFIALTNSGQTKPTVHTTLLDARLYAKNTLTIKSSNGNITKLVFNISTQGLKRLAPITASVGTIATQAKGDNTVTWSGEATEVTLTVGDKANYGSDGESKAGQLDFDNVVITTTGGGSTITVPTPSISGTTPFTENTEVTISGTPEGGKTYYTTDGSNPTSNSTLYSAPFTLTETTTVKAISYDKDGNASSVASKKFEKETLEKAANIAALLAFEKGKKVTVTLNNAIVLYKGTNDIIIKDATGGTDFYQTGLELTKGQVLNGTITVLRDDYNGFKEAKKTDGTNLDNVTITEGTVTPTNSTVANVATSEDCADLYKLENVEVVANGSNWDIVDGETTLRLRDQFKLNYTATAGKFNIIGVIGNYNGTKQFWPTEAPEATQEITISEVSDINEFKAQPKGKPYKMTLENAQVVYSWTSTNGNVQSYVRDETGALCFFFAKGYEAVSDKFAVNNILNGSIVMQSNNSQTRADAIEQSNENTLTSTTGTAAEPVKIDATKVSEYLNDLVLLENVTIEEKEGKYYVGDVQLYNQFHIEGFNDLSSFVGEGKNVKGIAVIYQPKTGDPVYEIYPIEITSQGGGETPQGTDKTWNFSEWEIQTISETKTIDGLTVVATADASVAIDSNDKTVDDVKYTQRLKLGGTGSTDSRILKFDVTGACTIKIILQSSSSGADRTLLICKDTWDKENPLATMSAPGAAPASETYKYTGEAGTIIIGSQSSGINLYAIYVTYGSSGIQNVVKPVVENGIRYNLAGQRVDENYKGVVIMNGKKYVVK